METQTEPDAVRRIRQEHRRLMMAVEALRRSTKEAHRLAASPDFGKLRAQLVQRLEVPVRENQASENNIFFPLIAARCPVLVPVLKRLQADHARGELNVRELKQALAAWEAAGAERGEGFDFLLQAFSATYLGHMEVEEQYVIPVAMDYLSPSDWEQLEMALSELDVKGPVGRVPGR